MGEVNVHVIIEADELLFGDVSILHNQHRNQLINYHILCLFPILE